MIDDCATVYRLPGTESLLKMMLVQDENMLLSTKTCFCQTVLVFFGSPLLLRGMADLEKILSAKLFCCHFQ